MKGVTISRQLHRLERLTNFSSKMAAVLLGEKDVNKVLKISVEGNIGSGKSTVLNYFNRYPFIQTYDEPLDKWRNVQGHNLLEYLYVDMSKWSFPFQSFVQLTRTQIQTSTPKDGVKIQMFERSVQNNRYCFLENSFHSGFILPAQFAVLCEWFQWIQENADISLDLIVYLRTSPEVVYKRVMNRNRSEERTVSLEYLQSLHNAHEQWLTDPKQSIPVLVIDGDLCFEEIIKSFQKKLPALFDENAISNLTTTGDIGSQ